MENFKMDWKFRIYIEDVIFINEKIAFEETLMVIVQMVT